MANPTAVVVVQRRFKNGISQAIAHRHRQRIWFEALEPRVLLAGEIDPTYGVHGIARGRSVHDFENRIVALLPQSDGTVMAEATNSDATLRYFARLGKDGQIDLSIGENGLTLLEQKPFYTLEPEVGGAIFVDHLGRIILPTGDNSVVGTFDKSLIVSRYHPDGSPDTSWGGDGEVEVTLPPEMWLYANAIGAVEDSFGRITVGVVSTNEFSTNMYYLVRFNPDGSPDTTFGNSGVLPIVPPRGDGFRGRLSQDAQGRLIVSGSITSGPIFPFTWQSQGAIARFAPDGQPDPTFGDGGWVMTDFGRTKASFGPTQLDSKGRLVTRFVRQRANDPSYDYLEHGVMRLNPDGTPDTTFGRGSGEYVFRSWDEPYYTDDYTFKLAVQPDDKILTTFASRGQYWFGDEYILRLNADGTRDTTFGDGGTVLGLPYPSGYFAPNDIALSGNRILLAGTTVDSHRQIPYSSTGSWSVTALVADDQAPNIPDTPTDHGDDDQPPIDPPTRPAPPFLAVRERSSIFTERSAVSLAPSIVDSKFTDDLLSPAIDELS